MERARFRPRFDWRNLLFLEIVTNRVRNESVYTRCLRRVFALEDGADLGLGARRRPQLALHEQRRLVGIVRRAGAARFTILVQGLGFRAVVSECDDQYVGVAGDADEVAADAVAVGGVEDVGAAAERQVDAAAM